MTWPAVLEESDRLARQLYELLAVPRFDDSKRIQTSDVACSMSLEHWDAVRGLLSGGLLLSAVVIHRAQFEALVRSVCLLYAASDQEIDKLAAELTLEGEQAAKNVPQVAQMMDALSSMGPPEAYAAISRFKDNSWKALNSYVHAGIHPLRRHEGGYPTALADAVLCNANGLAIVAGMQSAVLSGQQPLVKKVLALGTSNARCMPPLL